MSTITDRKNNLSARLHGGSLNKVRNIEDLFKRASDKMLSKIDPIDTMRNAPLSSVVHDDLYNYSLPSDYKSIIDIYPQAQRTNLDSAPRNQSEKFDLTKELSTKRITIEASEGSKILRVNWKKRAGKVLNTLNSLTSNGTWSAVGTASGLALDEIIRFSGGGSIRFDVAATGDGIDNDDMTTVDLSDEDEIADVIVPFYIKNSADLANLNSVTCIWGIDLTTNYWTGTAQTTQADGTAFKIGWNIIKIPWSTATETGTVIPTTIDSFKITFNVDAAISDIRVDNIIFSIGTQFDIKYYSKYTLKNTAGTWIDKTTSDDDIIVLDNDAFEILSLEDLIEAAHQIEGADSNFDMNYARLELDTLYKRYKSSYPSQAKKEIAYYGSLPLRHRRLYG